MDSPGVGPSKIERLVHDRSLRLATGLAVAVTIPVAILFYFQFRSISALSQTSALVLRQLSQATSEGVTDVLVDALRTVRVDVLLKIGQRQTEPLDLPFIVNTFEQGLIADPFVDRFYVWSDVTTDHRGDVLAFDRTHHEFVVYPPGGSATDRYVDERTFPLVFFEPELASFAAPEKGRPETWRVRTGYDNQTIPQIIAAR